MNANLKEWPRILANPFPRHPLLILIFLLILISPTSSLAADPPLHTAIHQNQKARVLTLLKNGADPNAQNPYGVTPLGLACTNGNPAIIEALLQTGADPNTPAAIGGMTPLMLAARTGRPAPVQLLLTAGAEPNARDRKNQSALMFAAVDGHARAAQLLLEAGAERDAMLPTGFTPWFFAARNGHRGVIDVFLKDGADVDTAIATKDAKPGAWGSGGKGRAPKNGTSALVFAIENGHFELAAHLLKRGANANDRRTGSTPLHILSWVRKPDIGDGISGQPPPRQHGDLTSLEFAELLITKHGAEVDARLGGPEALGKTLGRPGSTPFLLASRTADLPLMKLLVKLGADPHLPNDQNRTPLLAAAGVVLGPQMDEAANEDETVAAVKYLLDELNADIDIVDDHGDTVMHAAAYKQSPKLVHLLADRGADIEIWNKKNRKGWTPSLISQGFRYGNFKPSAETEAALAEAMRQAGIDPPLAPPPPGTDVPKKYED